MLTLAKHSLGTGDRFGRQAAAQLSAFISARNQGIHLVPVWNKSNREHTFIGSEPAAVRAAANRAVVEQGWSEPYYVDADHINIDTVDRFIAPSDFFTIDVAHFIGAAPEVGAVEAFVSRHPELSRESGATTSAITAIATKYLAATAEAGRIYRHIAARKGEGNFITEVSMDETDSPQTPTELLVILAALADERIPLQTIAPKFTGQFNKGVDYVGNLEQFAREFRDDLSAVAIAVNRYGLPANLKLSIHSGSDKFSLYPIMAAALAETGAGLHVKTAGTTWLEELIGLAEGGGEGLAAVKAIYGKAWAQRETLCQPYATVIDIDFARLPDPAAFADWPSDHVLAAIRHDPACPAFDPNVRQLLHVGFKIAAKMGTEYLRLLDEFQPSVSRNVTDNIFRRHILPLWSPVFKRS